MLPPDISALSTSHIAAVTKSPHTPCILKF